MSKIFNRKVSFILLVIWIVVILYFSSMNGYYSSNLSTNILQTITYGNIVNDSSFEILHLSFRKFAHIIEYFILTALIYNYLSFYIKQDTKKYLISFVSNMFVSMVDEYSQTFAIERIGQLSDVLIDSIGAIIFLIIIIIYNKYVAKRKSN